jgi:predicted Zn-dependent protease
VSVVFGGIRKTPEIVSRALDLAQFAVKSVPDDEIARVVLSYALLHADRREEAIAELNHAILLNPHYPSAHGDLAEILALQGRTDDAMRCVEESTRLRANDPTAFWRFHTTVIAKFAAGDDWGALEMARKVVRAKPDFLLASVYWAASAASTDNFGEAAQAVERCLSCIPDLTLANVSPRLAPRYTQDRHQGKLLEMLRKAGFPE